MEDNMLVLVDNSVLTETERTEINLHIDDIIEIYRQDSRMLSLMALESASLATAVEARSSGIMQQGFFSRLWNSFTGKNQKLMASSQQDIARAQYLSQQMLNKLFEQNLVQFEVMAAIEHKVNILAHDILDSNQKLLKICNIMSGFLEELREIKTEMAEFRRNDDLLFWKEIIRDDKMFQGKCCNELQNEQKIVCIANDFFTISKGKWNHRDLLFLKSVMREVELDPDETVIPVHILKFIMKDESLLQRFFRKTGYDVATLSPETPDTPFLTCLAKLEKLNGEEQYLVETVSRLTTGVSSGAIRLQMVQEYIRWLTGRNMENSMSCFDMIMELVNDLFISAFLVDFEEIGEEAEYTFKTEEEWKRKKEEERKRKEEEDRRTNGPYGKKISGPLPNMEFVWIPADSFMMGSPEDEPGRSDDEKQHLVTLTKGFYIQITPVTQAQWKEITGNNPSHFRGDSRPVEMVSWNDVQAFIKELNRREGTGEYRLPTEAQWEYACRAGTTTALNSGERLTSTNGECKNLNRLCWYDKNSGSKTHPVVQKVSNAWGLFDMHGNIREWCQDWYGGYSGGHVTDPAGASSGAFRVFRGGSWYNTAQRCRSAFRDRLNPSSQNSSLGFRLVRVPA